MAETLRGSVRFAHSTRPLPPHTAGGTPNRSNRLELRYPDGMISDEGVTGMSLFDATAADEKNIFGSAKLINPDNNLLVASGINLGVVTATITTTKETRNWLGFKSTQEQSKVDLAPVRYDDERHVVTIAPSRSGKGTTAIIPTLLDYDGSVLVIDPKGQNAAVTARQRRKFGDVRVINPFGLHIEAPWKLTQDKFNPLAAIDPESDNLVADVTSLCEALIINDGKDSHWTNSARDLVSAIIMYLITTPGRTATLPEMRRILSQPYEPLNVELQRMAASPKLFVAQRAGRFLAEKSGEFSREIQSILSTALTQTSFLDDPAIANSLSGDDFRFADLKTKKLSVFLVLPSRYIAAYSRWLRLFVVSAVDSMLSSPKGKGKPVLFVLDEFASLGHLSSIETAMALAAGFGVRLWPILQDINQAKDIYDDRWETFLANAGILQAFSPNDMTTAEYLSKRCGTRQAYFTQPAPPYHDATFTPQISVFSRPLALPQELMGMLPNEAVLFLSGLPNPIFVNRLPYYDYRMKWFFGLYDRDPYHQ